MASRASLTAWPSLERLIERATNLLALDAHGLGQARDHVAAVDLDVELVLERHGRTDLDLDVLGRALADSQVIGIANVGKDGLIKLVTGNANGLRHDDTAHGDNGDLGGTAADIDDHGAGRLLDRQVGADGSGHGLLDQVCLAGTGLDRSLKNGALLDRRDTGGDADDNARTRGPRIALLGRLVDKIAKHGLGNVEVGDNAVLKGTHSHNVTGRTAEHALCLDTDSQDALIVLVDGDNGGSRMTMPLPRTETSVLAVPRSMARSPA